MRSFSESQSSLEGRLLLPELMRSLYPLYMHHQGCSKFGSQQIFVYKNIVRERREGAQFLHTSLVTLMTQNGYGGTMEVFNQPFLQELIAAS